MAANNQCGEIQSKNTNQSKSEQENIHENVDWHCT